MTVPRGIRNNNPGNIVQSDIDWHGEVKGFDSRFESFDTPLNGARALCKLLLSYQSRHGLRTTREIITRWAPPSENDTTAYAMAVAAAIGYDVDTALDLRDPPLLHAFATAVGRHENTRAAFDQHYPPELMERAVGLALGIRHDDVHVEPSPAPAPQPEEKPMAPALAFVIPAITELIKLLPQIGSLFGKGMEWTQDPAKMQAASTILETVQRATGASNAQEAVQMIATDPAVKQVAAKAVEENWYAIAEAGGGGIGGAREFIERHKDNPEMTRTLKLISFWVLGFLTFANFAGFIFAGILAYHGKGEWQQITSTLIQADINAAFAAIGFWLGSSLKKGDQPSAAVR